MEATAVDQRHVEIPIQIVNILNADRESEKVGRAWRVDALDAAAMFDQTFDTPE